MEAPPNLNEPPCLALFPRESPGPMLSRCQPYIRNIIEDLQVTTNASPEAITAVALATIASAVGPNVRVQTPLGDSVPVVFNLAVCHQASRTQPWFDHLVHPLLSMVFRMQSLFAANGIQGIRDILSGWEHELEKAKHSPGISQDALARMEQSIANTRATAKPNIISGSISFRLIGKMLAQAFDNGITVMKLGTDPGEELIRLKSTERARVIDVLNRSWIGAPLMLDRCTSSGTVSLLWQTQRSPRDLLGTNGLDPQWGVVSVLMFAEHTTSALNPPSPLPHQKQWAHILELIFERRCRIQSPVVFTVSEGAEAVLHQFCEQVEQRRRDIPTEYHAHWVWLPDLARRLALLFSLLGTDQETSVDVNSAESAAALTWWLARQHLCSVIGNPGKIDATARIDRTDKTAVMYAKIAARGPISRRDLRRSFDNPRAEWFTPALDALISSGRVQMNEQNEIVVCQ